MIFKEKSIYDKFLIMLEDKNFTKKNEVKKELSKTKISYENALKLTKVYNIYFKEEKKIEDLFDIKKIKDYVENKNLINEKFDESLKSNNENIFDIIFKFITTIISNIEKIIKIKIFRNNGNLGMYDDKDKFKIFIIILIIFLIIYFLLNYFIKLFY